MARTHKSAVPRPHSGGGRSGRGSSSKKHGGGSHNWGHDGDEAFDILDDPISLKNGITAMSASSIKARSFNGGNVHVGPQVDY
ncbi:hypothetical protein BC830DRAFT_1168493 [Chytriomyces sp. MP71]|nr:hypothetical protein BC830DRAFT_1168493 [Chytriomyces sp. MP71]